MYNYYNIMDEIKPEEILMYLRKSRTDDPLLTVDEVLSNHELILDEWCERNLPYPIPKENRFKEIISGGESIRDRLQFQRILKMLESPQYKAVIVKEISRLGRPDKQEIGYISNILRYTKTVVITPTRIFNIADDFERKMFEQELEQGHFYLEYSKNIMGVGRTVSVSKGNFIGSIPPYGYDKVWVKEDKKEYPTLAENKEQADVVRLIFDLFVNKNLGYRKICNTLDDMKITPPKGQYWSPAALKDMLSNVHYIGKTKWNWRKTVTVVKNGEIIKTRPKTPLGELSVYEGRHQAIVSEELFNAAQEKKGKNSRTPVSKEMRNPFAGILFCECGRVMSLRYYKKKDGTERCSPRIICDRSHCDTGSCTYDEFISSICDILEQHIKEFSTKLKSDDTDSVKIHQNLINNLEKKLRDLQAKELSQWEAQSDPNPENRMPQDIFKMLNAKLLKEKEETQQALNKAYDSMPEPVNYEERIIKFQDALSALKNPKATAEEKNILLKSCIERIEYKREKPERLKKKPGEKKGEVFKTTGAYWSNPPIEISIKLNV
jgi:DNA invertase Pin-like site-specific DNA recombinase